MPRPFDCANLLHFTNMKNLFTRIPGIIGVVVSGGSIALTIMHGQTPNADQLTGLIASFGVLFAKQHNVTGGSIQQ